MKMTVRELEAIQESIRHAKDIIYQLACTGGGYWNIEDEGLRRLYLDLNEMCLAMQAKIREAEEGNGNG